MNTIIMIFALPIGIYILYQEKRAMRKYQAIFDDFFLKVNQDEVMEQKEKVDLLEDMLYGNRYDVVDKTKDSVTGEKKLFSVGWMFVGMGMAYIGLVIYIIYFFYFQKPHSVYFKLN